MLNDILGKEIRICFVVYNSQAIRYDIRGKAEDVDDRFIKVVNDEKTYIVAIENISYIEVVNV